MMVPLFISRHVMTSPSREVWVVMVRMEVPQDTLLLAAAFRYGPQLPFLMLQRGGWANWIKLLSHRATPLMVVKFHLVSEVVPVTTQVQLASVPGQTGLEVSQEKFWAHTVGHEVIIVSRGRGRGHCKQGEGQGGVRPLPCPSTCL